MQPPLIWTNGSRIDGRTISSGMRLVANLGLAIVDSGPLIAALDPAETQHRRCAELLSTGLRVFIPTLVVTEVCYFLSQRPGPIAEARFVASLMDEDVWAPSHDDWPRIAELIQQYADFPLGVVDASVVALAERLEIDAIVTLDRRHFSAIRPRHCEHFRLLPE